MDRNQAIGLGLIAVLLLVYMFVFQPKPEPVTIEAQQEQAFELADSLEQASAAELTDTVLIKQKQAAMGTFASAATGSSQTVTLQNENLRIGFNTKGGTVQEVELKHYKTWNGEPLILLDQQSSNTNISFETKTGQKISFKDLYFTPQPVKTVSINGVEAKQLKLVASVGNGQQIEQVYTLPAGVYQLEYNINFKGLQPLVANKPLTFTWKDKLKKLERDLSQNRNHSTINYYTTAGNFDYLKASSVDPEAEELQEPVKWVANKQSFFTAGIVAKNQFQAASVKSVVNEKDTSTVKTFESTLLIPANDVLSGKGQFTYYFGPNDLDMLKKVGPEFDRNLDLGWGIFSYVNRLLIIPAFDFLENYIASYGIIIILLVLYIKLLLFPLTYKSYVSMAKMKVLKPEIDAIKERNEGDMQKTQVETMKLYSEVGASPLAGCIPMLLQIPILFAMFNFFPNSIELRQEAFLWANDLSTYDVFAKLPFTIPFYGSHVSMFTLLMTASTILYTWSNNQVSSMQGPMKFYSYLMPVIFMFVLNSFPAGLSFYYFVSNIVTFGQQAIIRKFVDEGKIKA
ncbi:MAG: membrane protein insertase YidC, partial [Hymenobacteraceae bacterium]|nr:membrane protein insertase YidC [Hymenobacteraceae bacterium]MDX5395201.1 membrane protein insertase YidC [Hymenobacteraceae bacterium]MDX5511239.1 membrane protein insertase YidC [Hymenobacteraceae bacterium]